MLSPQQAENSFEYLTYGHYGCRQRERGYDAGERNSDEIAQLDRKDLDLAYQIVATPQIGQRLNVRSTQQGFFGSGAFRPLGVECLSVLVGERAYRSKPSCLRRNSLGANTIKGPAKTARTITMRAA